MEDNKYSRGKIYKLVPKVYEGEYIPYYGSTIEKHLSARLAKHKCQYKANLKGKSNFTSSFKLFDEYGIDNIEIILIEDYNCNNKYELESRERYYIENNNCINKQIPTRTAKEHYEDNKDKILEKCKKYREENNEHIKEYKKEYAINNNDKIKERNKKYREDNIIKIKDKKKKYYEDNKNKILEKIDCLCGGKYVIYSKTRHLKSNKHMNFINNNNNNDI